MSAKVLELVNLNNVSAKHSDREIFINMRIGSMFAQEAVYLCFTVFSFRIPLCLSCLLLQPSQNRWLLRFDLI